MPRRGSVPAQRAGSIFDNVGSPQTTSVFLRPLGTPLPLGFIALAAATTVFGAVQLGWLAADQGRVAAQAALAFTVPLLLLATVLGFLTRDPVAGTGMAVQAGTWAAVGTVTLASPPGTHSAALGVVLLVSAAAQAVSTVAAITKLTAAAVMALSAVRFAVTGVADLTANHTWLQAAGVCGLALGVVALFAAMAFELEAAQHPLLPTGRRGAGREALDDDFVDQTRSVAAEAGVRRQL